MLSLSIANITFDCESPLRVAEFWAAALERSIDEGGSEFFCSIGMEESGPSWLFLKVPEPKTAKNRLHLDLGSDDRSADLERLIGLGATHVADKEEWGHSWSVLNDIEGNEFCLAGD